METVTDFILGGSKITVDGDCSHEIKRVGPCIIGMEKEMATYSSVLAWRIPGTGSLVGCRLRGHTESDTTEAS